MQPTCDRAASRRLRNAVSQLRDGDLYDADRELRSVIRMVEQMETERGVRCACKDTHEA